MIHVVAAVEDRKDCVDLRDSLYPPGSRFRRRVGRGFCDGSNLRPLRRLDGWASRLVETERGKCDTGLVLGLGMDGGGMLLLRRCRGRGGLVAGLACHGGWMRRRNFHLRLLRRG